MAFRGYFIFESCSFGSATSKTEMYRNVNDSLYYKDRIEYEKTMIHFLLLWEKKPFPINLVFFSYHKIILRPWENAQSVSMEQNWNCLLFALKNIFSFGTDGRFSLMMLAKKKKRKKK